MALRRRELIRKALEQRLHELWPGRIAQLVPAEFTSAGAFVSELQAQTRRTDAASLASHLHQPSIAACDWFDWEGDCLEALRRLSLGEQLPLRASRAAPVEPFMASLRAFKGEPDERWRLLTERYSCPLNIALDCEQEVREHLLERLMVQDRARIEKGSIIAVSSDDVLLRLNLISVYAARSEDLRYLDALNYYYELWPERWKPEGRAPWLFVSYLGLYARALSAWLKGKLSE